MALETIPNIIRTKYKIFEWNHAIAILEADFSEEFQEILGVLMGFQLMKADILSPGGKKSSVANKLDGPFYEKGWLEKEFKVHNMIDDREVYIPTHKIDCYKNRIGIEIEWNNKDPFFDRDLNNFRLLFELNALSVGVIITRSDELQEIFNQLGKGKSYGASTTHWSKLIPRIEGRGGGGCPILVFGITPDLYID